MYLIEKRNMNLQNDALVEWVVHWRQQTHAIKHYQHCVSQKYGFLNCGIISFNFQFFFQKANSLFITYFIGPSQPHH